MGIIPGNGYYGCWRDRRHRGRNFARVIKALLGCSWEEANRLAGKETSFEDGDDLLSMTEALFDDRKDKKEENLGEAINLEFPKEFKEIKNKGVTKPYYDYLLKRGFKNTDRLIKKYEIYCCNIGEWKKRLIFPVYYKDILVTWIGRSIYSSSQLSYKDLSIKESVRHAKYCLYNYDSLIKGGKVLMIGEGLFDMLKLDYYSPKGFRATCLFTKTMTDDQKYLLTELSFLYEEVWLVLDQDAYVQSLDMASELFMVKNLKIPELPEEVSDPGEMSEKQVISFIDNNG